jgi:tetratricopeptide (TPR) repeat protein
MKEAVVQSRKALAVLADLPDSPERRQQELDLQGALGWALAATSGWSAAEVSETLARVRALAGQLNRPEHLVGLIASQWRIHLVRAEHGLALALGEQLENIGETRNDTGEQSLGQFLQGASHFWLGELVAARALLEASINRVEPARHGPEPTAVAYYADKLGYLALTLAHLGYVDQAWSRMYQALSEARRLGNLHVLVYMLGIVVSLEQTSRSPLVHLEELLALSTEHRFRHFASSTLVIRGRSFIALGQAEEGLALLRQGREELRAIGAVIRTPSLFTSLAMAHAMLGQQAEARNCLAEAARIVEATGERMGEAELLHRVPGDLLSAAGDQSGAEQHYRQAIAVAERQSAKLFQLRASTSLARLWRDQGKRAEARDLLGPIYHWFTEGFDAPDLKDAKALLEELA